MAFTTELKLDRIVVLRDRNTNEILAEVKVASFVQYPYHTAVRLSFDAPQSTRISLPNGNKDLKNGGEKTQ